MRFLLILSLLTAVYGGPKRRPFFRHHRPFRTSSSIKWNGDSSAFIAVTVVLLIIGVIVAIGIETYKKKESTKSEDVKTEKQISAPQVVPPTHHKCNRHSTTCSKQPPVNGNDCLLSIDFDANVKQIHSSSDLTSVSQLIRSERHLAVLYMHLDYCPYCHQAAPLFSQLASATNDKIQFYAIDCEAVSCSDSLFGKVSRFPTVALIAHTSHKQFNETEQKLWVRLMPISASDPQSIQNIKSAITSMTSIEFADWRPEPFNIPIKKGKTLWVSEPKATHSPIVRRDAAISGMIKILDKFVFAGQKSIQGTRLDALRFFLEIVSSTFPSKYVRKACAQLKGDLEGNFGLKNDSVQQSRSALTFEIWASSLKAQNFSKTSSEFCKTFTCELWSLFHILSLSSDRKFNTGSNKTTAAAPFKVLELSRITVDHFFYCSTCRKHYLKSYETREFNRPGTNATRDQVVLWFWNIHNAVSARASKERGYQVDSTAWPSGGQLSKSEALKAIEKAYWTDEWVENTETMTEGPIVTLILFGGITSCLLIMLFDYKTVAYSL